MAGTRKEWTTDQEGSGLFVVATPIGNLEDITLRALRVLKEADLIAAEGVDHTRGLCRHFDIRTRLISYNQNNRTRREPEILSRLRAGKSVALVTSAGTPGVSDPGSMLIHRATNEGIRVIAVPGPCAAVAALSASGLRSDGFLFAGFLSSRPGRRRKEIEGLAGEPRTLIFYEAPRRIRSMIEDLQAVLGDRNAAVARELTKVHEEVLRGPLSRIAEELDEERTRGEITVVVEGAGPVRAGAGTDPELVERIEALLGHPDLSLRDVAEKLALERGMGYRHVYKLCLAVREAADSS
jgi:16S rRNA (cytidine1402-2'-O)-methyltransferase